MFISKRRSIIAAVLAAILLGSGCGGGDGGGAANHAPSVNVANVDPVIEFTTVTLTATGNDTDGDQLTFEWEQTAGPAAELSDVDGPELTFIAPKVSAQEELKFSVSVSDGRGGSDTTTSVVTVTEGFAAIYVENPLDENGSYRLMYRHQTDIEPRILIETTSEEQIFDLALSPDHRQMAFIREMPSGATHAHTITLDGSVVRNLSESMPGSIVMDLAWSGDGTGLFLHTAGEELYFADATGAAPPVLISGDIAVPEFGVAPTGKRAWVRIESVGGVNEIFLVAPGTAPRQLSPPATGSGNRPIEAPQWSKDGRRIAFAGWNEIGQQHVLFAASVEGTEPAAIVSGPLAITHDTNDWVRFELSPNGNRAAFSTAVEADREFEIYVVDLTASDPGATRIKVSGAASTADPFVRDLAWSPDGSQLAFSGWLESLPVRELFVVDMNVADPVATLREVSGDIVAFGDVSPGGSGSKPFQWSPNSRRLLFSGDLRTDADDEIYVSNSDGTGTRTTAFDYSSGCNVSRPSRVTWSPDSTSIATNCVDPESGRNYLWHTTIPSGEPSATISNLSGPGVDTDEDGDPDGTVGAFAFVPGQSDTLMFLGSLNDLEGRYDLWEVTTGSAGTPARISAVQTTNSGIQDLVVFNAIGSTHRVADN